MRVIRVGAVVGRRGVDVGRRRIRARVSSAGGSRGGGIRVRERGGGENRVRVTGVVSVDDRSEAMVMVMVMVMGVGLSGALQFPQRPGRIRMTMRMRMMNLT